MLPIAFCTLLPTTSKRSARLTPLSSYLIVLCSHKTSKIPGFPHTCYSPPIKDFVSVEAVCAAEVDIPDSSNPPVKEPELLWMSSAIFFFFLVFFLKIRDRG